METVGDRVIIDTDILVDILRGVEESIGLVAELERRGCILSTTIINALELYYGAYKSKRKQRNIEAARRLLGRMIILGMGLRSAEKAGKIQAELEARGEPIGMRDSMIGAIALTRRYRLATKNIEHFQRIEGLTLIKPYEGAPMA
ncbi:type II toxin-antitoxin system VapC family toxin [Candidatus Bathyarchaeota archaeon]|nr:type II toxin-antitoxin system VapC family toxin [Candidatus Bathyarchaeota archaeon]